MMKSQKPHDDLLARYEDAKAQWPNGLPDQPRAALHESIMLAASQQVSATDLVAPRADSMTAIGLNSLKNAQATQTETAEASNDSLWNIRALGSLAVMGLAGLLWWQFEHGTPDEREATRSATPSATVTAAAPAPAPATALADAPASAPAAPPASAAESIAPSAAKATTKLAQAKTAPQPPSKEVANKATPLPTPITAPAPTPAPVSALETARARDSEANASIAAAPAAAPQTPLPPAPPPAAAQAPMAKSVQQAERTTIDSSASGIQYAAPAASPPAAVANAPRVMAAPAPASRAFIASPDKLFQAIEAKDAAALRQALSQSASPNANAGSRSPEGHSALTQAVIQRWPEGVRILLSAGADRNAKNNKGHTASDVALELGDREIIELFKTAR